MRYNFDVVRCFEGMKEHRDWKVDSIVNLKEKKVEQKI